MPKSYGVNPAGGAAKAGVPTRYKDIDIAGTDPNKEQFEPTDAQPIRQSARMAGDPAGSSVGAKLYELTAGRNEPKLDAPTGSPSTGGVVAKATRDAAAKRDSILKDQ